MTHHRTRSIRWHILTVTATLSAMLCGCANSPTSASVTDHMTDSPHSTIAESRIELGPEQSATLRAELFYSAQTQTVYVRYRIRNESAEHRLAVFDRGVYGDWAGAVYAPGPVGTARIEVDGGDLTVAHVAVPPPAEDPLRRHAPLARVLTPGQEHGSESATQLSPEAAPRRLRWCVGVARFVQDAFRHPQDTANGTIWVAEEAAVAAQRRLCTPWYDVAAGRLEG